MEGRPSRAAFFILSGASPPLRHRGGVAVLGRWKTANTANLIMLAVLAARIDRDGRRLWRGTVSGWRYCLRRFLLEGGVPEMRTGRAEKPIPSASDPSTWSGRLWTGERRRVFPPNHGDYSAVTARRA